MVSNNDNGRGPCRGLCQDPSGSFPFILEKLYSIFLLQIIVKINIKIPLRKWDSMKLQGCGLCKGGPALCIIYISDRYIFSRTRGSLPSNLLSQLLSLCKNIMTSANRRKNFLPLPPEGQLGRLPRHSIFIFTPSIFLYNSIVPRFLSNPPESLSP